MNNKFNIVVDTQDEKYKFMEIAKNEGARVTNVSGYYNQYIIHTECDDNTARVIDDKFQQWLKENEVK